MWGATATIPDYLPTETKHRLYLNLFSPFLLTSVGTRSSEKNDDDESGGGPNEDRCPLSIAPEAITIRWWKDLYPLLSSLDVSFTSIPQLPAWSGIN